MTLAEDLASRLAPGTCLLFGQVLLSRESDGGLALRHQDDQAAPDGSLEPIDSARALRELCRWDADGKYRPLKTSPSLKAGWISRTQSAKEFLRRLDAIYPGAFASSAAYRCGRLAAVPLRATLDRQTGMYRFAGSISDEMAERIVDELCLADCLRRVVWPIGDQNPDRTFTVGPEELPMICTEACTFAVNRARALAKEAFEAATSASSPSRD